MHESALRDEVRMWDISDADSSKMIVLPDLQELAAEAAEQWTRRGRPIVHELHYIKKGRRLFRGLRWLDSVQMTHGGCMGRMKFGTEHVYLLVSDEGELFFSFESPENRKFYTGHSIEDFEDCVEPGLGTAFLKNVRDLLDDIVRQQRPISR